jgi:hypothetical protein
MWTPMLITITLWIAVAPLAAVGEKLARSSRGGSCSGLKCRF